jgi:protein O-mannosyl-transferase
MSTKQSNQSKTKPKSAPIHLEKPKLTTLPLDLETSNPIVADANFADNNSIWKKIASGYIPYLIICILGIGIYANTFHHEYALDDDIIICKNRYVLQGVSKLDSILNSDVFASFYLQMNTKDQLSGGRYRPLSQVTYALEQEAIGSIPKGYQKADGSFIPQAWDKNGNGINDPNEDINKDGLFTDKDVKIKGMGMRHVINVLLYILSVCVMFKFLSGYFFKENKLLALLTCLLFIAHPIHTEVVANVKSRDEILSLLFMMLTMLFSFKAIVSNNWKHILVAVVCYFAALLSKEYGVTLLVLIPLAIFLYFKNIKFKTALQLIGGLLATFAIYYYIRQGIVLDLGNAELQNTELLNNPFKLATDDERIATQIFINLKYFILLLVPYKLSCDYSYGTIPYQEYSNIGVIISVLVLIASGVAFFITLRKKSWLAFPIAFVLMHLFLINNLFFNIGATMGERLVYHSSFGICILMAYGIYFLFNNILKSKSYVYALVILPIIVLYSLKTIARNPAWKNDITLHLTDVKTYPTSTMLCGNACTRLIELSELPNNAKIANKLLDSAAIYGHQALKLHPEFVNTFINLGIIKSRQNDLDSAAYYWGMVEKIYPHHPQIPMFKQSLAGNAYSKGLNLVKDKKYEEGLVQLNQALKSNPNDAHLLYDIGVTYYTLKNYPKAAEHWRRAAQLLPTDTNIQRAVSEMVRMNF